MLIGPAGSGKSRTLRAARQAWEQAGITVRGVAPSAGAAGVLTEQAGIPSDTLARFLLEVADRRTTLNPGEVFVCDEASMVSTCDLARLVLLADAAGAKVVLVGGHLPARFGRRRRPVETPSRRRPDRRADRHPPIHRPLGGPSH